MKGAVRLDRSSLGRSQRLENGFLKVPITATRVGIFVYRLDDGSEWREFRPPEEVFSPASMASLKGVPATNEHPSFGLVNSGNAKDVTVGFTGDDVAQNGDLLDSHLTLIESQTIAEVETGVRQEVSAGYECDLVVQSGSYRGERYDAIQTNIRYNHVAVVQRARGGSEVRIHLDSADKVLRLDSFISPQDTTQPLGDSMETIMINGVEYRVGKEAAAAITARFTADSASIASLTEKVRTTEGEVAKATGRADAADALVTKLKGEAEKALRTDSDEFRAAVQKRVSLELFAKKRLDSDVTKMSDKDIIVALIKREQPSFKCEGKTDNPIYLESRLDAMFAAGGDDEEEEDEEELDARFDSEDEDEEDEEEEEGRSAYQTGKRAMASKVRKDSKEGKGTREKSAEEVRAQHMSKTASAWSKPTGMSKA